MKTHLVEKYLTEAKFDSNSFIGDMNLTSKDKRELKNFVKGMSGKITADSIVRAAKQLKLKGVNEASGAGASSEIWFGYNRSTMIYVQEGEVLFSLNYEFPPGSLMDDETRQRAVARGYVLLDVK